MKIVSKGFVDGFYYKPRIDEEVMREYHEGIIALSACLAGEVPRYLEKVSTRTRRRLQNATWRSSVMATISWSSRTTVFRCSAR